MLFISKPVVQTVSAEEMGSRSDEMLRHTLSGRDHRVLVERDGRVIAALISAHDLERFDLFLQQSEKDFEVRRSFAKAFEDVPEDELQREIDRAVAEARAELRAKRDAERLLPR